MNNAAVENLANQVIEILKLEPPINLELLAREEGIELVPGHFGSDFQGRIEYLAEERVFAVYYPQFSLNTHLGRTRFTIAHELGHYFIPEHREILLREFSHNSEENLRSSNLIEKQADMFAASLLIPSKYIKSNMGRRGFLTLDNLRTMAHTCQSSLQATVFRYTQFTSEPHLSVVSEDGKIIYHFASQEARAIGFGFLNKVPIPSSSSAVAALQRKDNEIVESSISSNEWFPNSRRSTELWEESINLGYNKRVLTLLSWQNYEN